MTKKNFYIGLDVHKRNTTYVVKDWNGITVLIGECATTFNDLYKVLEPYTACCTVAMEACTSYYKLYKGFKSKGINALVANVCYLRRIVAKNDKVDAARLADMLRLGNLPTAFIPEENIQHLRTMVKMRNQFVRQSTRLKNQIHALLDFRGSISLGRTPFCKKWCLKLQDYIAETGSIELKFLFEAQQDARQKVEKITSELLAYTKRYFSKEFELLQSIPGIGPTFAAYVVAEVMPINRFMDKKKLRRYAGVIPVSDMSDKHVYATYVPKSSSRSLLRYALVEAAHTISSVKKSECRLKRYFNKKKKEKQHYGQAVMCVASALSDIVYNVLTTGEPYTT